MKNLFGSHARNECAKGKVPKIINENCDFDGCCCWFSGFDVYFTNSMTHDLPETSNFPSIKSSYFPFSYGTTELITFLIKFSLEKQKKDNKLLFARKKIFISQVLMSFDRFIVRVDAVDLRRIHDARYLFNGREFLRVNLDFED